MLDWQNVVKDSQALKDVEAVLKDGRAIGVYPQSAQLIENCLLFLVKEGQDKFLIVVGSDLEQDNFAGQSIKHGSFFTKKVSLTNENAEVLRNLLPWTAPQPFGSDSISIGLGDRLGLASPGHIKAIKKTPVQPVLAQQSMRELELTNRTYTDVLDAATWAVFQEGYKDGFGADGDHLKSIEDIRDALELGFSMITLDCSDHIDDGASHLSADEASARYAELPEKIRLKFEELYRDKKHSLNSGTVVQMNPARFHKMILTYYKALQFIEQVYREVISTLDRDIDFEISIDEVATPTDPQDHFFVANELADKQISISAIAPRFCGSFEKGIDYIGDVAEFEKEFAVHTDIARHFGYKLSVHSGSDKFSVFPIVGKLSQGAYHVKTAGTNWLEAVRVIADVNPALYRRMHEKALESLEAAKKYYEVSLDLSKVPNIAELSDDELSDLLNQDDARQLLHITYGFILQDKKLREPFYATLVEHEDKYDEFLQTHLKRHLESLGL